jgi:hypothetical protein
MTLEEIETQASELARFLQLPLEMVSWQYYLSLLFFI